MLTGCCGLDMKCPPMHLSAAGGAVWEDHGTLGRWSLAGRSGSLGVDLYSLAPILVILKSGAV